MKIMVLIARLVIGGLFIYAAVAKIPDPSGLSQSIRNYQIVPAPMTNILALVLPWVELIAGAGLILGIWTHACALITTAMLLVFASAVTYAYSIGLDISCGCFGAGPDSSGVIDLATVSRDWGLTLVSASIILFHRGEFSLESFLNRSASPVKAT
jgi:uncharacterized membrane protein YphA (DoxX/SURF4 family)